MQRYRTAVVYRATRIPLVESATARSTTEEVGKRRVWDERSGSAGAEPEPGKAEA